MARTNEGLVKDVVDVDPDLWSVTFISLANNLVNNRLANKGLTEDTLTDIETYLAAHFYALRDQQYQSKSTGKASATFGGKTGMGLEFTRFGQMAMTLDPTNSLSNESVGIKWLGSGYE